MTVNGTVSWSVSWQGRRWPVVKAEAVVSTKRVEEVGGGDRRRWLLRVVGCRERTRETTATSRTTTTTLLRDEATRGRGMRRRE